MPAANDWRPTMMNRYSFTMSESMWVNGSGFCVSIWAEGGRGG